MTHHLRLEDRQLITDKLHTYCWGVDHDDADTWISTFTNDVHFEFGEVKIDGKEDLKTWISTEVIVVCPPIIPFLISLLGSYRPKLFHRQKTDGWN